MSLNSIDFYGFATNGGVDEDNLHFWLRKVFQKNHSTGYCTHENVQNVNIAGVLSLSQNLQPSLSTQNELKDRLLQAVKNAETMGMNSRRLKEMASNESFFMIYGADVLEQLSQNVPELVTLDGETREEMSLSVSQIITKIRGKPLNFANLRQNPHSELVLIESISKVDFPCFSSLAFIKSIRISRKGGFTCPVKTLIIFSSMRYIDIQNSVFDGYNNLWTIRDVKALVESSQNYPSIFEIVSEESYTMCEFKGKMGLDLQPIVWISFESGENVRIPAVTLHLSQTFPSLYLYSKLITPEDCRVQRGWEHDLLNIDLKYIAVKGEVVDLTNN